MTDQHNTNQCAYAWFVVRAATRQEQRAVASLLDLKARGVAHGLAVADVYMPAETLWRRSGRTKTTRQSPLMPGYLFVRSTPAALWIVEEADGVYAVLRRHSTAGDRRAAVIPDAMVTELRDAEAAGAFDKTKTVAGVRVEKGEKVRVGGNSPLAGWVGEIQGRSRDGKVKVLLSMIGATRIPPRKVDLAEADLEPAQAA